MELATPYDAGPNPLPGHRRTRRRTASGARRAGWSRARPAAAPPPPQSRQPGWDRTHPKATPPQSGMPWWQRTSAMASPHPASHRALGLAGRGLGHPNPSHQRPQEKPIDHGQQPHSRGSCPPPSTITTFWPASRKSADRTPLPRRPSASRSSSKHGQQVDTASADVPSLIRIASVL